MPIDRALFVVTLALVGVGLVFGLWPQLDLAASHYIYDRGGFWGARSGFWRDFLRLAPMGLLGGLAALWAGLRLGSRLPGPSTRSMIFLIASLTLGSGLIVNLGLKDHSHRPRPVHVAEFGGDEAFRPWFRFDGACGKNCAFASGEAASGVWMIAPALLVPPPWRIPAVAAALVFGAAAGALRVAFGGHFVSDALFGGLISALVVLALRRWLPR